MKPSPGPSGHPLPLRERVRNATCSPPPRRERGWGGGQSRLLRDRAEGRERAAFVWSLSAYASIATDAIAVTIAVPAVPAEAAEMRSLHIRIAVREVPARQRSARVPASATVLCRRERAHARLVAANAASAFRAVPTIHLGGAARRRIARSSREAVVRRGGAGHRLPGEALPLGAIIPDRAGVAVIAGCAEVELRVRALAGWRIAHSNRVTLVLGRADNRVSADALAGVTLGAEIPVVAGGSVRLIRIRALPGLRIADARVVALILRGALHRIRTVANAREAEIGLRASIPVVAGRTIRFLGIRALPGLRVARSGSMTLIERGADDRVTAYADAVLAGIGLGTGIPVVAGRPVALDRIRALAGLGIARPRDVALVKRRTDDGI